MQQFFATWFCPLFIQIRSATDISFQGLANREAEIPKNILSQFYKEF